ncbi:MAG TPA: tetratricopeptide repeat protein, partial [Anaerolineae bacterium]|nr:tetratricopeptide repeat protein [Anaerolineae bacterium]
GQALYRLGRIEDGIEWLNDAWTLDQSDPAIPLSLAFGYRSLGQSDELAKNLARAERLLTRLLAVAPHNLRALYDQGLLNEVRGRNDLATYSYQRIVQLDPAFYLAYINLGQTYTELGRFRDAEQTLRAAVQVAEAGNINPSRAWRELGLVLAKLARRADAEAAFRTAINLSPDLPWAYFHYARFLEEQGRFEEALLNFRMVQRTSADTAWTNQELGDFFQRHEMHANAIRYYQQGIMAAPTRALMRVALAKSQYAVGNKSAAWQAFDEAVRLAPDDPYVYAVYGWTLLQSGQRIAAAQKYEEARARDPDNENTLTALARIYQALGNQTGAEPVVCQLVQSDNLFAGEAVRVAEEIRVTMDIDCAATS